MQVQSTLDKKKMEAFGDRLLRDNAASMRSALNYIGDKLGLFKALNDAGKVTAPELARKTGLNERYLQEWLSAMVAGEYVTYDPAAKTFFLPVEHAAFLADTESPMFSGALMVMIKALFDVTPEVAQCFQNGGGVPHSKQSPEMDEATERFSRQFFRFYLTQEWIPLSTGLGERLKKGALVADVGCGAGESVVTLAKAYPNSEIWGYDNFAPVVDRANARAKQLGLKNAHFAATDILEIDKKGTFDIVTAFDVIHDMSDPVGGMKSVRALLRPDGVFLMCEMNVSDRLEENINPFASMLYSVSTLYCMTVSLAESGAGIGACMGERRARKLAEEAGFSSFTRIPITHPFSALYLLEY